VVVYNPSAIEDFCTDALLELAHLGTEDANTVLTTTTWELQPDLNAESGSSTSFDWVAADKGYESYQIIKVEQNIIENLGHMEVSFSWDQNKVTASAKVSMQALGLKVVYYIWLQPVTDEGSVQQVTKLFLTAWELNCCPTAGVTTYDPGDIAFENDFASDQFQHHGLGSEEAFRDTRLLNIAVRGQILQGSSSKARYAPRFLKYAQSEAFLEKLIASYCARTDQWPLSRPVTESALFDETDRNAMAGRFRNATVEDILRTDSGLLARQLGMDVMKVKDLKFKALKTLAQEPAKPVELTRTRRSKKRKAGTATKTPNRA
jgi:hypothetical protein